MASSVRTVLGEVTANFGRVWRLTLYEKSAKNKRSLLGNLWEILNPLLNIVVYWFVFSVGLRTQVAGGASYPYVVWLITGLVPWLTISSTMSQSSISIISSETLMRASNVPLSIFPMKAVMHGLVNHGINLVVMLTVLLLYRVPITWHIVEVIYYSAAMLLFLFGFALISSMVTVYFNDLQKLLPPTLRLLMYASGVVVDINHFPDEIQALLRLNPLAHLIEGIRACMLDGKGILTHPESFASFWIVTLLMFLLGCWLHIRYREEFVDRI